MIYALDTSTIIACLRSRPEAARARFAALGPDKFRVPEVVRAELWTGAMKSAHPERNRELCERFLAPFAFLPFGGDAVEHYASIRCALERTGEKIGPNDLLIAATARAAGAVMVTCNAGEFSRVPGLVVEDWTKA